MRKELQIKRFVKKDLLHLVECFLEGGSFAFVIAVLTVTLQTEGLTPDPPSALLTVGQAWSSNSRPFRVACTNSPASAPSA